MVTPENWEVVLPRFYGLSRREALEVVAALQPNPAPPVRTVITATRPVVARDVPAAANANPPEVSVAAGGSASNGRSVSSVEAPLLPPSAAPALPPAELVPLTANQRRLHATVSAEFARKLEQAKDVRPNATIEEILEAGLDLLLAKAAKQKGLVDRPQKKIRPSKGDKIPAHVRREVMKRDQGRCQWRLPNGQICGCTRDLQFDHIEPLALGGKSTVDNVRILCRAHNIEAARRIFGDAVMDRYTRKPRRMTDGSPLLRRVTAPPTG